MAIVDPFSNFNVPQVGKPKGYPKRNLEKKFWKKFFCLPHFFLLTFEKIFFFRNKKKPKLHSIRNRLKKKLLKSAEPFFQSKRQNFSRTDGDTDIFAEQHPPWHKLTPFHSARFARVFTLREWIRKNTGKKWIYFYPIWICFFISKNLQNCFPEIKSAT